MRARNIALLGALLAVPVTLLGPGDEEVPSTGVDTSNKGESSKKKDDPAEAERQATIRKMEEWLKRSGALVDESDPCLSEIKDYMELLDLGTKEERAELEEVIQECQENLNPQEITISKRNFAILESQTSYATNCGGEKHQRCREAQEKVANHLRNQGETDWNYSDEILWAYDEDGKIIDAAAFPGYQKSIPHGDHDDLLSISVQWDRGGNEVYGLGVSSEYENNSTPLTWSRRLDSLEELSEELGEILPKEDTFASHD